MECKQYSIGVFASMNKVSTRMLRHYDKIGLLRPVSILPNGYRCYSEEQIETISQIKRLRDCNFLLEEIDEILRSNTPQFLADSAKRKLAELQEQAAQQQTVIRFLRELARETMFATPTPIYGVSRTQRRATNLLVQRQPVLLEKVEDSFDALFRLLQQRKLYAAGCTVLLSRFDSSEDEQTQVGVSIAADYGDDHFETLTLPAASVLSVVHYGDYYTIGHAYSALLQYARQNEVPVADLFLERYFLDRSHGVTPKDYVTEISVAIENTP